MNNQEIIDYIISLLTRHTTFKFEKDGDNLMIYAHDEEIGLDILLMTEENENTLYLGEFFHWHFNLNEEDTNQMIDWIIYGLTGYARVKEFSKRGKPYKGILQIRDKNDVWQDKETMRLSNFYFWIKPTIKYHQNDHLPIELFYNRETESSAI